MKSYKILAVCMVFALQCCVTYYQSGFIIPEKSSDVRDYGAGGYRVQLQIDTKDEIHPKSKCHRLTLKLPQWIKDERCSSKSGFIVANKPHPECDPEAMLSKDERFFVRMSGNPYTEEFIKNLSITLFSNGKEYKPLERHRDSFKDFQYPITIKEVENHKDNYLLIKYKDIERKIPIKYEMKWHKSSD